MRPDALAIKAQDQRRPPVALFKDPTPSGHSCSRVPIDCTRANELLAAKRHAHAQPLEYADVQTADSPPVGKQANIYRIVALADQPGRRAIDQARQLGPFGGCRSSSNAKAQYQPVQNLLPLANCSELYFVHPIPLQR